ncbi:MAG TPA: bifunctional nuclease family protein [Paludibacteraceae bacterium]|mgnify:FL=1|nr:bifunctional nuclease family protein [Paludibacteraceae bacterium]HOK35742.1 bifunctional nuclease family protein [Paludibacteraceae bacterium]HOL00140.1 bifunctional nuclease family protein [Paludibacteraceae bacterium]HPO67031.1 bifunctional nuclease family protein [Paludibacteraceae bacterium]HRU63119.1 bifunctional nuclease family protein [Paludibacteraceae bacterium]
MDSEIKLVISGLVYNQNIVGTYGLILSEESGNRRFSVMIGEPEAQSIALKLNNKKLPRPLTHDLIKNILDAFEVTLVKVLISDMINDVFYSELHIKKDNKILVVDSRTSDAIALAVRCNCPIYIKSEILDMVGVVIEPTNEEEETIPEKTEYDKISDSQLDRLSLEELDELLSMAVNEEKYELAVHIRDAINRKKSSKQ